MASAESNWVKLGAKKLPQLGVYTIVSYGLWEEMNFPGPITIPAGLADQSPSRSLKFFVPYCVCDAVESAHVPGCWLS